MGTILLRQGDPGKLIFLIFRDSMKTENVKSGEHHGVPFIIKDSDMEHLNVVAECITSLYEEQDSF